MRSMWQITFKKQKIFKKLKMDEQNKIFVQYVNLNKGLNFLYVI